MNIVSPSELDVNNPGGWPLVYKVILWIVMFVAILFLYNNFVRQDLLDTQSSNQATNDKLKVEYENLYQYTIDLPIYKKQANELLGKLNSLLVFLPSGAEMPDLIDNVSELAQKNSINLSSFIPREPIKQKYYNIMPIDLKATTGFKSFVNFSQNISELTRVLNIENIDVSLNEKALDRVQIESQLRTYIYTQNIASLLEGIEGVEYAK